MHNKAHTKEAREKMSKAHIGIPLFHKRRPSKIENDIEVFRCGRCLNYFPRGGFYRNKRTIFGLTIYCKKCHMEVSAKGRNPDNTRRLGRESARRQKELNPEKIKERHRLYARKRIKTYKDEARMGLNIAVKSGKIIKPRECSKCGKELKLSAHHDDYNKPLDVIWFCYQCHSDLHRLGVIDFERV